MENFNWIPIQELTPTIGEVVLVFMDKPINSSTPYAVCLYSKYGFDRARVTHWQCLRLPEYPKNSKGLHND